MYTVGSGMSFSLAVVTHHNFLALGICLLHGLFCRSWSRLQVCFSAADIRIDYGRFSQTSGIFAVENQLFYGLRGYIPCTCLILGPNLEAIPQENEKNGPLWYPLFRLHQFAKTAHGSFGSLCHHFLVISSFNLIIPASTADSLHSHSSQPFIHLCPLGTVHSILWLTSRAGRASTRRTIARGPHLLGSCVTLARVFC